MTSVADILKKHGKWIEASALVKKIVKANSYENDRQGWREYRKAWKNQEIRKITQPDRTVLVGLQEWATPSKESFNFEEAFYFRCFKELEEINHIATYGHVIGFPEPLDAFHSLRYLIARLPKEMKNRLKADEATALQFFAKKTYSQQRAVAPPCS